MDLSWAYVALRNSPGVFSTAERLRFCFRRWARLSGSARWTIRWAPSGLCSRKRAGCPPSASEEASSPLRATLSSVKPETTTSSGTDSGDPTGAHPSWLFDRGSHRALGRDELSCPAALSKGQRPPGDWQTGCSIPHQAGTGSEDCGSSSPACPRHERAYTPGPQTALSGFHGRFS